MSVVNPLKKGATLEQLRRVQEYEDGKIDELKGDLVQNMISVNNKLDFATVDEMKEFLAI